jgi:hypothetical protein
MVGQVRFSFVPDVPPVNVSTTTQYSSTVFSSTISPPEYTALEVVVALTFTVGLIQVP